MAATHRGLGPRTIRIIPRKMVAIAGALIALTGTASPARAQWNEADTHTRASFRGLSVAPDGTVWAGGTEGTVMRSSDAGET